MSLKIFIIILCCFLSYIFGSFNYAIFITRKFYKKNIKKIGSKNAGTTNVFRNFGIMPALITFVGDFLKGFIIIFICNLICFKFIDFNTLIYIKYVASIFAIIGHIFPIFYGFKGGKGVAVFAGSIAFMDIKVFLVLLAIFILTLKIFNIVSLSSIFAALIYPISVFFISFFKNISTTELINKTIFSTVISIILIFAHRDNIKRLLEKKENKLKK